MVCVCLLCVCKLKGHKKGRSGKNANNLSGPLTNNKQTIITATVRYYLYRQSQRRDGGQATECMAGYAEKRGPMQKSTITIFAEVDSGTHWNCVCGAFVWHRRVFLNTSYCHPPTNQHQHPPPYQNKHQQQADEEAGFGLRPGLIMLLSIRGIRGITIYWGHPLPRYWYSLNPVAATCARVSIVVLHSTRFAWVWRMSLFCSRSLLNPKGQKRKRFLNHKAADLPGCHSVFIRCPAPPPPPFRFALL